MICQVNGVAFTPDGERVASCSDDGSIRVWACATGALVHAFVEPDTNRCLRILVYLVMYDSG